MNEDLKATMAMTAGQVGRDLLGALVTEVKLLPDVWPKLPKSRQDDVIDRLRKRVEESVKMAVHLIAAEGRTTIVADLEQVTVKDGIKAVLTMGKADPNRHQLFDSQGKQVLVVVADAADHMGDTNGVTGEADQRGLDLGHEYDPNGDGKGMPGNGDDDVVDAEYRTVALPAPDVPRPPALPDPTEDEVAAAYEAGRQAAAAGQPKESAPVVDYRLVKAWTQGWMDFHANGGAS